MRSVARAAALVLLGAGACAGPAANEGAYRETLNRTLPGGAGPIGYSPFDGSFEIGEPEYYTIDPRVDDR